LVAYNFKARFADAVANGSKRQTIRAPRKGRSRHARLGEPVQLYTGLRTKAAWKLRHPDPICIRSTYCHIHEKGITFGNYPVTHLDDFAKLDGFADFEEMKAWFRETHGLPFIGQLIEWEYQPR
jgi:hypothetical protein